MADKVVAKYVADVKDYIKEIEKATGIAQKDFEKVNKSASGLEKGLKKIGGAMAAAFAVDRIVSFTSEASKLAAQGEGIRKAFERVGDPKLLDGLRQATRGTVSDLELMKQAVRASNFKIPMESLAKLFEFARRRAKETGESVDYLVNSITMGIGRKSPLILDNLGISAIELRKRFDGITIATAEVGDVARIVGDIATEEMEKMGDEAITTADRVKELDTAMLNLKEQIGGAVNKSALFYADLFGFIDLNEGKVSGLEKAMATISKMEMKDLVSGYQTLSGLYVEIEGQLEKVTKLQSEMDGLGTSSNDRKRRAALMEELETENARLDMMRDVFTEFQKRQKTIEDGNKNRKEQIHNVAFYTALIKKLTEEQELENTSLERNAQILKELIAAQKALDLLKGKEKKGKKFTDKVDPENEMPLIPISETEQLAELLREAYGDESVAIMEAYRERENELAEAAQETANENWEKDKERRAEQEQLAKETFSSMMQFMANVSDIQREYELQNLEKQLEAGLITEEEFQRQRKALARDAAVERKGYAIFGATINTAEAVTNALAKEDFVSAILYGVMGAAQIATIAAQPIPQFAKGTKNAPSGFKWVGEEGPELIHDGGGYPIITHRESMKILEKYNIESVDIDSIQRGGFDGMAASAKMQGFSDSNMLVGIDRNRSATVRELRLLRKVMQQSIGSQKRRGNA